jgi:hypothetical protein
MTAPALPPGSCNEDFWAYRKEHKYIFIPTGDLWPQASIDSVLPRPAARLKASDWLDQNRSVEQVTWSPGEPQLIQDKYVDGGGWLPYHGARVFNFYRAPKPPSAGDPAKAQRWVDHVSVLYPETCMDIIYWCASRVQNPSVKINHALVLGGDPGIGKDTLLEPVRRAVGDGNTQTVQPPVLLGRFSGYLENVILVIAEARDMGEFNRYQFYEHMKPILAAPPYSLTVDRKNIQEYRIPNVVGVIITTNHKAALYLTADDRRHLVCWSSCKQDDFPKSHWTEFYRWYEAGGYDHVHAYLLSLDLGEWDPKAPPPKTQAFWELVAAGRPQESGEIADLLETMGYPKATTVASLLIRADDDMRYYLMDRKNRKLIGNRMADIGYTALHNPDAKDGLWKVNGKRQVIYVQDNLPAKDQFDAARRL